MIIKPWGFVVPLDQKRMKRKNLEQSEDIKRQHPLSIAKVQVNDPEYESEVPQRMRNKLFPGFPSSTVIVGQPGSGKSNLLMHMLLRKEFWLHFYDEIYLFGPTVKSDKLYSLIDVPEDHVCADADEMIPKLKEILAKQQADVETDKKSAMKCLIVFEDLTSFFHKVQSKPEFLRCYTQYRHLKGSSVCMVHKWKAFNRTARMSARHIIAFDMNLTDRKQLYQDFGPPNLTEKEWLEMMHYALSKENEDDHPFFYINTHAPLKTRFRRNFTEILELEDTALSSFRKPAHKKRRH